MDSTRAPAGSPDAQISPGKSIAYWSSHPPTVNSMLGGYPQISRTDLRGSAAFWAKLLRQHPPSAPSPMISVDCGAGIGRVTAGFLSDISSIVDVVEPVESFAKETGKQKLEGQGTIGEVFVKGIEDWTPEMGKYDLIWNQWCTLYLTDKHLVDYLKRCRDAIKRPDGWIIVKENTTKDIRDGHDGKDVYDEDDSSVTRTNEKLLDIFRDAGLTIVANEIQKGFPKGLGLYPVRMYALRPEANKK
ncbi:uncharacterized protein KY384_001952 [Bacidia gigantensis]|uniref:uncharacterized protein n=1 Tax=Bacidia gigantensis TaxID=2732470 RepID=UPI001D044125|nr:uncharacterized protein KY384_001952 [Bacidia gigantensis]KAG8533169.1 hypothetical protein KY384_001952 [Bacidia gigantensis]